MNLIVNYIWGDKYTFSPSHQLYLNSFSKLKDCAKLVIVEDMNSENIEKLNNYYDYVEVVKHTDEFNPHKNILETIEKKFSDYDFIFFTDSYDVIFQSDPFEYFSKYDYEFFLTSPGFKIKEQWPDQNWHEYFNKTLKFPINFYEDRVLNGAFVAGKLSAFLNFYVFVVTNLNRNGCHIVDQTVFNYYYSMMQNRNSVHIFDTRLDNFIYHCQNEHFFGREEKPNVVDGKIYTKDNQMYCIWHQWDDIGYSAQIDEHGDLKII